jgi:hypothetical protein
MHMMTVNGNQEAVVEGNLNFRSGESFNHKCNYLLIENTFFFFVATNKMLEQLLAFVLCKVSSHY